MRATFEEVCSELAHRQDESPWSHFVFVFRVALESTRSDVWNKRINRSWLVELGLLDFCGPLPTWIRHEGEWSYLTPMFEVEDGLGEFEVCTQQVSFSREDLLAAMEDLYGPEQMGQLMLEVEPC